MNINWYLLDYLRDAGVANVAKVLKWVDNGETVDIDYQTTNGAHMTYTYRGIFSELVRRI